MACLLLVSGCARLNPEFDDGSSTTGVEASSTPNSTLKQEDSGSTLDPESSTTGGPITIASDPTTTSGPLMTGSSEGAAESTSTGADVGFGAPVLPGIILFGSQPVVGSFASVMEGNINAVGSEICSGTFEDAGLELGCDDVFPILGWSGQPLPSLHLLQPDLDLRHFEDLEGSVLAEDFQSILDDTVPSDFGARVTAHLQQADSLRFWWGYSDVGDQDCDSWTNPMIDGVARQFAEGDQNRACEQEHSLLCACVPSR